MEALKSISNSYPVICDGTKYYFDGGYYISKNRVRLHIYVWEKYNGSVPKGYHIHHKDFNSKNNDIDNLQLMTQHDHLALHGSLEKNKAIARTNMNEFARPKAIEWHKSENAKQFHKDQYKKYLSVLRLEKITIVCEVCGKNHVVDGLMKRTKYCSNNCKSQARRNSGTDNEEVKCLSCDNKFMTNKYCKRKYCSKECMVNAKHEQS